MSNAIKDWFPLYAGDWLTSMGLRLCSPVARGILIDLMAYSWQTGEPGVIADEHHDLALFFHCTEETFSNAIAELALRNCIVRDNGRIIIKRLQVIAGEQIGKHELRRKAGRKGGLAKAENMRSADDDSSNALASSSNALAVEEKRREKSREEETKKRTAQSMAEFDAFWQAYPRKVGKQNAGKAWKKLKPPINEVLDALTIQCRSKQWTKDGGEFIPHPTTWLNRGGWEDGTEDTPKAVDPYDGIPVLNP